MELVCRHLSNHACARNPEDSPSLSVRSQHDAGTGVGGAGHPGAVNSEQHQHHQQGDDDDTLDVHAKALLLLRLVVFHFLRLAHLHSTGNNGESALTAVAVPFYKREKVSGKGASKKDGPWSGQFSSRGPTVSKDSL